MNNPMLKMEDLTVNEKRRLYNKVISLKKNGLGYVRASKILDVSKWTLANWMIRNQNPLGNINLADLKPSLDLSYILGVMQGDGSVFKTNKKSYRISLACKDMDFMKFYLKCLRKVLKRKYPFWKERDNFYKTQSSSKELYEYLISERWVKVAEILPKQFIRGFFDSEGWVDINSKRVCAANSNLEIIVFTNVLLKRCGIKTQKIQKRDFKKYKTMYEIRFAGKNNLEIFQKNIGFSILRKNQRLKELLSKYEKQ